MRIVRYAHYLIPLVEKSRTLEMSQATSGSLSMPTRLFASSLKYILLCVTDFQIYQFFFGNP